MARPIKDLTRNSIKQFLKLFKGLPKNELTVILYHKSIMSVKKTTWKMDLESARFDDLLKVFALSVAFLQLPSGLDR